MEIALAYQHLIEQYGLTQERLSDRVGKKRATIANYLRLLKLPAGIQVGLQNKEIDMGHARALIALDDPKLQMKLYKDILLENYSVRKVEEMVKALNAGEPLASLKKQATRPKPAPARAEGDFALLKEHLAQYFRTPVQLTCNARGKGKITLTFENEQDLERIIALFDKLKE